MPEWQRNDEERELLAAVARELRRPVRLSPALDARVMAEVRRSRPASRLGAIWEWLREPRALVLTPLGGMGLAGAMAALLVAVSLAGRGAERAVPASPLATTAPAAGAGEAAADTAPQLVQFVIVAPGATSVALVGDFNDWQVGATPLRPASAGRLWTVEVPLPPGRHRYAFVVDGERWLADPAAPQAVGDDFGQPSSVVTVSDVDRRSA